MQDWLIFLLSIAAILLVPGPTNTLMATAGAVGGFRRAVRLIPCEMAGYGISVCSLQTAMSFLPHEVSAAGVWLKCAAAAYLIYLATKLWFATSHGPAAGTTLGPRRIFIATLLNPKGLVFALVAWPLHMATSPLYWATFMGVIMLAACLWTRLGALLGSFGSGDLYPRYITRVAATVIGFLASMMIASSFA